MIIIIKELNIIEEYIKTNREKRLTPRSNRPFWCHNCDRDQVFEGKKCDTCGVLNGFKRFKTERNAR